MIPDKFIICHVSSTPQQNPADIVSDVHPNNLKFSIQISTSIRVLAMNTKLIYVIHVHLEVLRSYFIATLRNFLRRVHQRFTCILSLSHPIIPP